jgi:cell wall assembly regulator SMI1
MLTAELLAELDQRLRELDAPVTSVWRPGLDNEQMDTLTAEIGLSLSTEARAWWAWHDGVERDVIVPLPGIGGRELLSLHEAVQDAKRKRAMAVDWSRDFPDDPRGDWSATWISFCGSASPARLACDCAVPAGAPSPVLYFDPEFIDDPRPPRTPSMGELVHLWLDAIQDGTWHIDPATGDFALLDPTDLLEAKGPNVADLL